MNFVCYKGPDILYQSRTRKRDKQTLQWTSLDTLFEVLYDFKLLLCLFKLVVIFHPNVAKMTAQQVRIDKGTKDMNCTIASVLELETLAIT